MSRCRGRGWDPDEAEDHHRHERVLHGVELEADHDDGQLEHGIGDAQRHRQVQARGEQRVARGAEHSNHRGHRQDQEADEDTR